jgi:LysM repeat protein
MLLSAAAAVMIAACETYETAPGRRTNPRLKTTAPAPAPEQPDLSVLEGREIVDHTVVAGDTLWELGRDYKVSVADIKLANGLDDDVIRVGQSLKIPLPEGTKVSSLEELPPPGEPPSDAGSGPAPGPPPTPGTNPNVSPPGSAGAPPLTPGDQPAPPPPPPGGAGGA